jgi:hypothetical protein
VKPNASDGLFGDFSWLAFFQSDVLRLAAIALVCLTLIAIFCVPKVMKIWAEDRLDQRAHERKKANLAAKVDQELQKRIEGRLDLDA